MENLLSSINNYFSDEFTSQLANSLDETQPGIQKTISTIIPLSLQRLSSIGENGLEGENELTRITSDASQYYAHSPNLSKLHNDERGSDLPLKFFGKDLHVVIKKIANFAGVKIGTAERLLTLVLPVITGKMGEYFHENNLSGSGMSHFLLTKKTDISVLIPAGYNTSDSSLGGHRSSPGNVPSPAVKKKRFPTWVMFVIIILVFLLLIYFSRL
ncbi:MAG: DUF937 domain-containing protein [Ginsengibacter sp.]